MDWCPKYIVSQIFVQFPPCGQVEGTLEYKIRVTVLEKCLYQHLLELLSPASQATQIILTPCPLPRVFGHFSNNLSVTGRHPCPRCRLQGTSQRMKTPCKMIGSSSLPASHVGQHILIFPLIHLMIPFREVYTSPLQPLITFASTEMQIVPAEYAQSYFI